MLALLCGGQGTLSPDLFRLTAHEPDAEPIFDAATKLLKKDPREVVRGDPDAVTVNRTSQILVVTATLAIGACIAEQLPSPLVVTGYSVGEMSAWSLAGVWTPETALRLTATRAAAMDEADGGHGHLGYVRGLSRRAVERLAEAHDCAIAIVCPGELFIVGGRASDVEALCASAIGKGATASKPIAVRVASHTAKLKAAVTPFAQAMKRAKHASVASGRLLIAGRDGAPIHAPVAAMHALAETVACRIDWAGTLEVLREQGVTSVLDLGPGHALADMARETGRFDRCHAVDGFRSIGGLKDWLGRSAS